MTGNGANCIMKNYIIGTPHKILLEQSNRGRWDWWGMWHIWDRTEMHMQLWYANLKERGHLKDLGVGKRIILQHILQKYDWRMWTGLLWLRLGTGGGLLLTW